MFNYLEALRRDFPEYIIEPNEKLPEKLPALCYMNYIFFNPRRSLEEIKGYIAEEIGHQKTTVGNIIDQSISANRKQEKQARFWGYEHIIKLEDLIKYYELGMSAKETAETLGVTFKYFSDALVAYREKLGVIFFYRGYLFNLSSGLWLARASVQKKPHSMN